MAIDRKDGARRKVGISWFRVGEKIEVLVSDDPQNEVWAGATIVGVDRNDDDCPVQTDNQHAVWPSVNKFRKQGGTVVANNQFEIDGVVWSTGDPIEVRVDGAWVMGAIDRFDRSDKMLPILVRYNGGESLAWGAPGEFRVPASGEPVETPVETPDEAPDETTDEQEQQAVAQALEVITERMAYLRTMRQKVIDGEITAQLIARDTEACADVVTHQIESMKFNIEQLNERLSAAHEQVVQLAQRPTPEQATRANPQGTCSGCFEDVYWDSAPYPEIGGWKHPNGKNDHAVPAVIFRTV